MKNRWKRPRILFVQMIAGEGRREGSWYFGFQIGEEFQGDSGDQPAQTSAKRSEEIRISTFLKAARKARLRIGDDLLFVDPHTLSGKDPFAPDIVFRVLATRPSPGRTQLLAVTPEEARISYLFQLPPDEPPKRPRLTLVRNGR